MIIINNTFSVYETSYRSCLEKDATRFRLSNTEHICHQVRSMHSCLSLVFPRLCGFVIAAIEADYRCASLLVFLDEKIILIFIVFT
jgi:hypothetical protein